MTPAVEVRPARAGDLPALAAFITRANAAPEGQSLHCPAATPSALRAILRSADDFPGGWERGFAVAATTDGEITAAFGCQPAPGGTPGYLWGPWVEDTSAGWLGVAPGLLSLLLAMLPSNIRRVDAFLHIANRSGLRFLQANGFSPGPLTHIYAIPRAAWPGVGDQPVYPPLRPMHEVAFANLHADTFPAGGSAPAADLLAGRGDESAIFAAADGLRLLGSVCVSVNPAPREGFIDYLAVKPSARGRGVGAGLLRTALRWAFEERGLPQAALTVSDWRSGARRLYKQAGFRLSASGIAMRRKL